MAGQKRLGRGLKDISSIFISQPAAVADTSVHQTSGLHTPDHNTCARRTVITATPVLGIEKSFFCANYAYLSSTIPDIYLIDCDTQALNSRYFLHNLNKTYDNDRWRKAESSLSSIESELIKTMEMTPLGEHSFTTVNYTGSLSHLNKGLYTIPELDTCVVISLPVMGGFSTQAAGLLSYDFIILARAAHRDAVHVSRFIEATFGTAHACRYCVLLITDNPEPAAAGSSVKIRADIRRAVPSAAVEILDCPSMTSHIHDSLIVRKPLACYKQDASCHDFHDIIHKTALYFSKPHTAALASQAPA